MHINIELSSLDEGLLRGLDGGLFKSGYSRRTMAREADVPLPDELKLAIAVGQRTFNDGEFDGNRHSRADSGDATRGNAEGSTAPQQPLLARPHFNGTEPALLMQRKKARPGDGEGVS